MRLTSLAGDRFRLKGFDFGGERDRCGTALPVGSDPKEIFGIGPVKDMASIYGKISATPFFAAA